MTHDYQLIRYELQKKTTKVQKKLLASRFLGLNFISYHRTTHIPCTLITIIGSRTAPNEPCYSNQVLDTQIL